MIVTFPDGSRVRASSIFDRCVDDPERSFGLYLDARWQPSWPADLIEWEDFGLPEDAESAARMIEAAFMRARRGELVEVGCLGGIGRTTLYELVKQGHLTKVNIGRRGFITAESLAAYVDQLTGAAVA